MSVSRFLQLFGLTLLIISALVYGLSLNSKIVEYIDITYYAIAAFSVLSILIYTITNFLEKHPDKRGLLNVVIINVMLKFFISISVIALYYQAKNPKDGIFVVPFILVYVVFTIFETYFMSEQARNSR